MRRTPRPHFRRSCLLWFLPEEHLTQQEKEDRKNLPYPDILADYMAVKEFHWDYWTLRNQPDRWVSDLLTCLGAAHEAEMRVMNDGRSKDRKTSHEHEGTRGLSIAKIRQEQDFPEDMPDEVIERIIGRVD